MKTFLRSGMLVLAGIALIVGCNKDDDDFWDWLVPSSGDTSTTAQVNGYVFRPALEAATDANVAQLKVPQGFKVSKYSENLGKPRIIAVSQAGHVYVSDRDAGKVTLLKDTDNDGKADVQQTVFTMPMAHGLAIHGNQIYITTVKEVYKAAINSDGTLGSPSLIISNLPDGGQHPNRTLAMGPDNKLYISIGSTCNSCPESNKLNATMVRTNPDGTNLEVIAKGLRNTIGFAWHPGSGDLWGMDHGIDWLGDNDQIEELNKITQNGIYGWPYIYGEGKFNPGVDKPKDTTYQEYLALTTLPTLGYQAHSAPMQMAFYTGSVFPAEYRNDAYVALRGSWNRSEAVGYKIVRIHFENNVPVRFDDFLTGFLVNNNRAHFARPVGLAMHTDGSLLMGDDTNGIIYRVSYQP
ncbi:MAG: sorbosone dehydrogenase family protein [Chitinophagaceae bacterium]|nr:MAG: sorbosone dehydrogenase family protein [Chitinophagaceae bacterium]